MWDRYGLSCRRAEWGGGGAGVRERSPKKSKVKEYFSTHSLREAVQKMEVEGLRGGGGHLSTKEM